MRHLLLILVLAPTISASGWGQVASTAHDGIPDIWKTSGVDITIGGVRQHLDLKSMGASTKHKDIFVWVAWMEDATHTHKPSDAALKLVKEAFARAPLTNPDNSTGIALHIVWAPKAVDEQELLGLTDPVTEDYDWTEFDAIKRKSFPSELNGVFFFCLFAHLMDTDRHSGITRTIPGRDFIVSLGGTRTEVGTFHEQAGTFMHELGHALGLRHGGVDDVMFKPNYISVMNYAFQFNGIPVGGVQGNLDYSRFAVSAAETSLSEVTGLSTDSALSKYGTYYFCAHNPMAKSIESMVGEVDWNCDGRFDADVSTDINADGKRTNLAGFNDWGHVTFGQPNAGAGAAPRFVPRPSDELTPEQADRLPVFPVIGVAVDLVGRSATISWRPIPLENVLVYRVVRRGSLSSNPVDLGFTAGHQFVDANLNPGRYEYTITAAFLPHSRTEHEKLLASELADLQSEIRVASETYEKGGKTATYGEPMTDSRLIEEIRGKAGHRPTVPPSQFPGLLLQTIPSRPVPVEVK